MRSFAAVNELELSAVLEHLEDFEAIKLFDTLIMVDPEFGVGAAVYGEEGAYGG
jgi:hypothetical protein